MSDIEEIFTLLGLKVRDRVTGVEGIVVSISFDLYGCIQAILNRGFDENGKLKEQHWFDIARLEVVADKPVMERPDFTDLARKDGVPGPAEKPTFTKA